VFQPGSGGVIDPSEAFRHMPVAKPLHIKMNRIGRELPKYLKAVARCRCF